MKQHSERQVAVIGAGCRLPGGVDSPSSLWRLLADKRDTVRDIPDDRWTQEELSGLPADVAGRMRRGAVLDEDVYAYDPAFFGINAHEAAWVDPHHRLLAETFWNAAEHAGIPPRSLSGKQVGIYFGVYNKEYLLRAQRPLEELDAYAMNASIHSMAAGRIAFLLDLQGPQMTVEAGCASGLAAMHAACQGLRDGEADIAFAGASSLILGPEESVPPARWSFYSPTGRCSAFDSAADGYVRGEGCIVLVLKRLSDAVRDNDRILGVIRGSAANQNGRRSSRLTAPSATAQIDVYRRALRAADVAPGDIGLVEAHGTGTEVGDPLEFRAVAEVYGAGDGACALGSIKTNIGHTEPVAGLAGLLKALLAVSRGQIPPNLHFHEWNPKMRPEGTRLFVPTEVTPWPETKKSRLAVVSSFSVTGSNVHVVIEQPPTGLGRHRGTPGSCGSRKPRETTSATEPFVILLSGANRPAVNIAARRLAHWLTGDGADTPLSDVAHTLALRRTHLRERLAVVASTRQELIDRLTEAAGGSAGGAGTGTTIGTVKPSTDTVFLFSGHGSQWAGMCRNLLDRDQRFTRVIDQLEPIIAAESGFSLRQTLAGTDLVHGMDRVQPTIFAVQVALCAMWADYGVRPDAVIGHSMGEAAAAVSSGALTLEEGIQVICRRSRLNMRAAGMGRMASIALSRADVEKRIEQSDASGVSVAVVTSPRATVVGGPAAAVERMVRSCQKDGIAATLINVDIASHTAHMDPILDDLRATLSGLAPQPPTTRFYTTVFDDARRDVLLDADYWAANQRRPVLLAAAIQAAAEDGHRRFVEISPHPVLAHAVHATVDALGEGPADVFASLHSDTDERVDFLTQVASLHCAGHQVDWRAPYGSGELADVPGTSWERTRLTIAPSPLRGPAPLAAGGGHPLTGAHLTDPDSAGRHLWQKTLTSTTLPWLDEHRVNGVPVLPGAAYTEMAIACATDVFATDSHQVEVRDLDLKRMLPLGEGRAVSAVATTVGPAVAAWELTALDPDGTHTPYASAELHHTTASAPPRAVDIAKILAMPATDVEPTELYRRMREDRGITHGPAFAGIKRLRLLHDQPTPAALADIELPPTGRAGTRALNLHPVLLDICLQAVGSTWLASHAVPPGGMLPRRLGTVRVLGDTTVAAHCHVQLFDVCDRSCTARCVLTDAAGTVLAEADTVECVSTPLQAAEELFNHRTLDVAWEATHAPGEVTTTGRWNLCHEADRTADARDLKVALEAHGAEAVLHAVTSGTSPDLHESPRGVVYLPSLDDAHGAAVCARTNLLHLTRLAQSITAQVSTAGGASPSGSTGQGDRPVPRLWVVTRDAQQILSGDIPDLAGSGLRGALRVLALEQSALRPAHLDIDRATTPQELARELLTCPAPDDDIAYRAHVRYIARLKHAPLGPEDRIQRGVQWSSQGATLLRGQAKTFDDMTLTALSPRLPGPGEIQVRLHSTSLNFVNALKAIGTLDRLHAGTDITQPAVFDGAGTVTAVGPDVRHPSVGDLVAVPVCWADDEDALMCSQATVRADWAIPLAGEEDLGHAAGLPIAYLTAWYGLRHLGRLGEGDRVLIHSATGGVGLAAVNVARRLGAQILATAGTETKREYLRSLGIRHVMDSRSLDYAEQVQQITGGRGLDVVLNALAGPAQAAGLELLARQGRFIEIGKRDIYENTRLGLLPFRRNITFSSVDIALLMQKAPALIGALTQEITQEYTSGRLPSLPMTLAPVSEASEVFRTMASAQHIGKLGLTWPTEGGTVLSVEPKDVRPVEPHGSYLVTGGLGGLGLHVATWLADRGAAAVVLGGRSEPNERARGVINELTARGVGVVVALGDLADPRTAESLVTAAESTGHPLRGIVHAAAVVEDATLDNVDAAQIQRVWDSKALAAWNLHQATKTAPLNWWISFTSVAAVIGQPGQTCYAAANSWLDEFTSWRRAQKLPATSIVWGPWAEHGRGVELESLGYTMITPSEGMDALDKILTRSSRARIVHSPADLELRIDRHPDAAQLTYYSALPRARGVIEEAGEFLTSWNACTDPARRAQILHERIVHHATAVLRCSQEAVDVRTPFAALGLDSLLAIQLRNRISYETHVELPTTALWTHPTPAALAELLADRLPAVSKEN
ncbi:Phthioceranic/hydroxyphthioceranic acid synthase [Actinomadura rubteroloni]|uniref:Phthioceranic/hydroxyphthioceranic acid synthase n=1 Tax=Actinomadura rubteroloni TaxID=1926885 RepID=A0A2P4UE34_9ACTN|nr:type I polyketide synthase [Actinomadura rubteroloni]POM23323.1 Phthioceranic/hydroxyphthioceranic acid synthase [Actinomadura rubteroloni]